MRTILRDLETLSGVRCGTIVRDGDVLASTFSEDQAETEAVSIHLVGRLSDGLGKAGLGYEEVVIEFAEASLIVIPIDRKFSLSVVVERDAKLPLLRVVMQSAMRQIRRMAELPPPEPTPVAQPPKPEPAKPAQAAKSAPQPEPPKQAPAQAARGARPEPPKQAAPPPKPEPPKPAAEAPKPKADRDAEPVLPKILELLTDSIGPIARVTFKQGVARWKKNHPPTVNNLGELAKILAADLQTEDDRRKFTKAVERLRDS